MAGDGGVLVVGADGLLGRAVVSELGFRNIPVFCTSRRGLPGKLFLDLSAPSSSWDIPLRASGAVICAAVTNTERCRIAPDDARQVNVDATVELAQRLTATGTRVVFLSTNLIFDGTTPYALADAPRCPRTAYGVMKADAEEAILALGELATVVRLTKVMHGRMELLASWRAALARQQPIAPFSDLPVAPLSPRFAAAAIASAATYSRCGVLHVSPSHDVTYADIANYMAAAYSYSSDLIRPVTVKASAIPLEHVPTHTTLDCTMLRKWFGMEPPDPWAAVAEAVESNRTD